MTDQEHFDNVRTVVIDGNKRYHVVTDGKITYTGNNPLKYLFYKYKGSKGKMRTTVRWKR